MRMIIDIISVVTAFVVIIYAYFKWSYQYWRRRGVPYLEPSVPYGNSQNPFKMTISIGDYFVHLYNQIKAKGWKHCGIYTLSAPLWVVLDLELVKNVMTKDFQHFVDRGLYTNEKDDPLSCHLFAIGGKKWRNLRTKLTPTFTSGKMKAMFQTVIDCGLVLEKYIEEQIDDKEAVDIRNILGNFTTDVIGTCAFGIECNTFKETDSPFKKYGRAIFEADKFQRLKLSFCGNFPNISRALGFRSLPKNVSDFFMKVVEDTVTYREKNNYIRKDFLQLLIDIKNNKGVDQNEDKGDGTTLRMDEIAAQCFVFFIAGYETSSTTMSFALYELSIHQEIQDKVREEINTVLAKHDNQITYDSLSELKYMKRVIDESLRKYPPVPFVTRLCVEDYKLPDEDIIIEKGTKVLIPIKAIQSDEEYYKEPEVFDPERFNEKNRGLIPHYAHIPFGEGPRICIGERFGIMQTKVGLTSLLRNFRITLNKKTQEPLKMVPKSFFPVVKGGIWLNFEKL